MTMQLFSFGHPCEHQLRRTCIGGSSCPLNGYPDNWCCSFIKGKINFKRDKPCEGPRCRWGFTHPSQAQFDAVTQVLNESRPIAAKIDDADDKEMLTFSIENARIVDTVQCALHMMRHPPSNCTTRVGQLLAYAALRAGDVKVFMQLLKTMKKPVDGYLLGAYEYLTSGNLPTLASSNNNNNNSGSNNNNNSNPNINNNSNSAQSKGSGKKGSADKKEDTVDELKNDMVDLMNAALSSGGQLVNREDQHTLQAVFIQALRSYPKSNKKRQEMLELAIAKFGNRQVPKNPSAVAAAVLNSNNSNANTTNTNTNTTTGHSPAAAAASGTTTTTTATTAAAVVAAGTAAAAAAATGTHINTNTTTAATTAAAVVATGTPRKTMSNTVGAGNAVAGSGQSPKTKETTEDDGTVNHHGGSSNNNNNSIATLARRPQAVGGNTTTTTAATSTAATTPFTASARLKDMTNPSPAKPQTKTQTQPPQPQPVVGISRLAMQVKQAPVRHYEPIRTDLPLPNIALFGGLFGLTVQSATWALLGSASSHKPTNTTSLATNTASAVAAPSLKTATVVAGALTTAATTAPSTTTTTTTTNASPIPHPGVLSLELSGGVDDRVFGFLGSHAPDYSFFSDIDGVADD